MPALPPSLSPSRLLPALKTWRLLLLSWLLLGSAPALLARPPHYPVPSQEAPVALLTAGRHTYLVTAQSVFELAGRQFVRRYQSAAPINCALAADTVLWLGTQQGLLHLSTRQWRARPLALPAPAAPAPITALLRDAAGTIWVGALGYGVYQLQGGALQSQLRVPAITAGLATPDSAVWIATNIGLHRWQHHEWTRFNEEGVANYEIPDNLVEQLLLDNGGSLWVVMSEGISVFAGGAQHGEHLPSIKYLGRPGNAVYSVAYLPGQGHVFATAMGLLLLPTQPGGELAHFEPTTDRVETPQVLVPLASPGQAAATPRLLQVDARQRIWVVSPGAVSVWRAKDFRPAAPAVAARPGA